MSWWEIAMVLYAALTAGSGLAQALENNRNGRDGPFWTPVWWVALTWPVWLVVIALDLNWAPHWKDPDQ